MKNKLKDKNKKKWKEWLVKFHTNSGWSVLFAFSSNKSPIEY